MKEIVITALNDYEDWCNVENENECNEFINK